MLSRHAENLFWAGRYLERADDTGRMLDVVFHQAIQDDQADARAASRRLLEVLRLEANFERSHDDVAIEQVTKFLIFDPECPGSVQVCLSRARENLRSTRELVSSELFEAVNRAYLDFANRKAEADVTGSPYQVIATVRDHCQTVMGVATQTMPRDEAWCFFNLGYLLERAVMTLRLVEARGSTDGDFDDWAVALQSSSSLDAFQRAARGSTDPRAVFEFLLLDEIHPRSVLYCLDRAERYLEQIGGGNRGRARRLLGKLRSDLAFVDLDEVIYDRRLEFLVGVEDGVRAVADALGREYFGQVNTLRVGMVKVVPGVGR